MLYMAAPVATSAIKTNRTNVIGCGLKLNSRIDAKRLGMSQEAAKEWQEKTEAEFKIWAGKKNACDATGVNDYYERCTTYAFILYICVELKNNTL